MSVQKKKEEAKHHGGLATVGARRKLLLGMALRRVRPGAGSADVFLRQRTAVVTWPDLSEILAGLPWAVVGAVATRAYMPERTTQDLDILVTSGDAQEVRRRLGQAGFAKVQELTIGGATWRSPTAGLVHVIESGEAWVREALRDLRRDPQGLPVLSRPYLVLMKVQSGRAQDLADATRMLGFATEEERQSTRELFERFLPDALEDLESLIALGKLEAGESGHGR
ncbi:MAG TPA: hypothetical protein VJP78_10345 [Thermoleophilia bacterium]|nr:hypothetical protein [Thermoleophilia bacterium]